MKQRSLPGAPVLAGTGAVLRRELSGYFATPLAAVFLCLFLALAMTLTFYLGGFFERGRADLAAFFQFQPWLFLFFAPAVAMRLWAEERRSGSFELLLTLPVTIPGAVLGKHLAAWLFTGLALLLTFPLWVTVNILGVPDNGAIAAGYGATWLMAGAMLAVSGALSAATRNQVAAFVAALTACFLLLAAGLPVVVGVLRGAMPDGMTDFIAHLSVLTHFNTLAAGNVDARALLFFVAVTVAGLAATGVLVDAKREQG